ncbi:MAG TPA: IS21-like element helper ATPase IstB [Bacteroidales bacterium]|nr:IS21-like element helper ATPase IstB [Bacteroidales bacterium]
MNKQTTLDQLQGMKLSGMMRAYQAILSLPPHERPTLDVAIARLAEAELLHRKNRKTELYLKRSKLRYNAVLEQVHCSPSRNLTKETLLYLAECSFIDRSENILITGPTGCGKSFLACAIGRQACSLGYKSIYLGMNRFLEKVTQSKLDGTYIKFLSQIEKTQLLIIDDWGLYPLDINSRLALLQVLEDRYAKRSTIITSQLPVAAWYEYINEPTLADAIMDRLSGNAQRIELKGESLRKKNNFEKND